MQRRTAGFTLLEVLVALMIGAILTSIAVKAVGPASRGMAVQQARNVFAGMAARARAQAIEGGATTMLIANTVGDSVMILAGGRVVETVRFRSEMNVDLQSSNGIVRLCMGPRGYARLDCNSFSSTVRMTFAAGTRSMAVEILPLGQVRW